MTSLLHLASRALRAATSFGPFDPTRRRWLAGVAVASLVALAPMPRDALADGRGHDRDWIGTWAVSPQFVRAGQTAVPFPAQTTLRQIVHTSIGGHGARVRFSNEYGTTPLEITSAHIALRSSGADIVPGTGYQLRFGGKNSVKIAPGAPVFSDAVPLRVPPLSDVVISIYFANATTGTTLHSVGSQTNYTTLPGPDATAALSFPTGGPTYLNYFFLAGLEVRADDDAVAIVTLGDSITDGTRSTPDTNGRWPNFLAERLNRQRGSGGFAVLNEGISGNRIFSGDAGEPTLARFDRDVLAKPGVEFMTLLIGINDIGNSARGTGPLVTVDEVIAGYRQIIARAHEHGIKVYGATLTPIKGSGYDFPQAELDRQAVNAWIRTSREFDAVIDFDAATRDPANPVQFLPAYDSGDHLHPNNDGYRAMAEAIPLRLFRRSFAHH